MQLFIANFDSYCNDSNIPSLHIKNLFYHQLTSNPAAIITQKTVLMYTSFVNSVQFSK